MQIGELFVQVSYIPSGPGDVTDATLALAADAADPALTARLGPLTTAPGSPPSRGGMRSGDASCPDG